MISFMKQIDIASWLDRNFNSRRAPILGIERHRIETDGNGVTTLVGFYGCPLRCKYCLNQYCHSYIQRWQMISAKQLYREVEIDNIYMAMTGGGVTFGGGEPCLRESYIREFRKICRNRWKINLETCLYIKTEVLECLIPVVDSFIVDVKDLNPNIYASYTGKPIEPLLKNLKWLEAKGVQNRVHIRVPLIPKFNTCVDQEKSVTLLSAMGFKNIELFNYIIPNHE